MSKELEEIKSIVAIHFGALGFLNPTENEQILKDRDKVLNALQRLEAIENAKPSEFKIVNYKGQYYLQINVNDDEATQIQLPLLEDEIKDVQLAIDKFKQIDNINPSEALEFLKQQAIAFERSELAIKVANGNYDSIKQALLKSQEQEKENDILKGQVKYLTEVVIEFQKIHRIIFEKNVSIFWIKECKSLEEYNYNVVDYMKLTEEEFELLKRYCNEKI